MASRQHTVAADDPRLRPVQLFTEALALGKETSPGQATQPLLSALATASPPGDELGAPFATEAILLHSIAMTPDREPDLPAHQFRVVDRDDAGVVRKEALVVDRPQFNERDRPIVLGVQNRDPKRLIGSSRQRADQNQQE